MKGNLKKGILLFGALALFTPYKVDAASIELTLENNTTKTYDIKEEDYNKTIYEFKESIANDIGIEANYQVFEDKEGSYVQNNNITLKNYFANEHGGSVEKKEYYLYERKELEGDTLTLKGIKPKENDDFEFYAIMEGTINRYYHGYSTESCNQDYTKCMIKDTSNNTDYKEMNIKYVYDENTLQKVNKLIEKIKQDGKTNEENRIRFTLNDLELVNYWLNGGSIITYSNSYKKAIDYKNLYQDIRAGDFSPLYTEAFGIGFYYVDSTLYGVLPSIGIKTEHILYVPTDTNNDDILTYIQNRIDSYVGKGKVLISKSEYTTDDENMYYENQTVKEVSADKIIYKAVINNKPHHFVVAKDTDKMTSPELITSDFNTDVTISSKSGTIPLDSMIEINKITSGEKYNKIINLLNITNSEIFDISLFTKSINKYITLLEDGSFKVKIPLKEDQKGKDLVVYYIDKEGNTKEYRVTETDGYAVFNTNHFSTYALGVKQETNPQTLDNITNSFTIIGISLIGLTILGIYLYINKEKYN